MTGWVVAWIAFGLLLAVFIYAPVDSMAQLILGGLVTVFVLVMPRYDLPPAGRLFLLFVALFITLRYLVWRTLYTIHFHDMVSYTVAVLLYLAELYGMIVYFLGVFVNIYPLGREPAPLPADSSTWPTVDIFIPTYNEPPEIIETTIHAAVQIRYPKDKVRVYLLDDGGTAQKQNDKNQEKAFEAMTRNIMLKSICESVGATYLTRERNDHAKAGNINAALKTTTGDLILILDTDHVPTAQILEKTVGWFMRDPKMFLIQTPHFFINADPLERNLGTFGKMPGESEMFYNIVQQGLDFWNAAYFCGSAAVLRRTCLDKVGGISGRSITEDCETALDLHALGYHSGYISEALIAGLAPETFSGFVVQRMRWAQGMIQIFVLKNPLLVPGLTIPQRLCYFSNCFFWFFSYSRIVFLLAPAAFLLGNLQVFDASWKQLFAYGIPHTICAIAISNYLYGVSRWAFISELYELMQCVYTLPAIIRVFINPTAPTFQVTPKGEQLEQDYISPLAGPFYLMVALSLFCIGGAFKKIIGQVLDGRISIYPVLNIESPAVFITLFWAIVNMMIILAALGALFEQKQRRAAPRVRMELPARITVAGSVYDVTLRDLSAGGIGLNFPGHPEESELWLGQPVVVEIDKPEGGAPFLFNGEVRNHHFRTENGRQHGTANGIGNVSIGIQFQPRSQEEVRSRVALLHGQSELWRKWRRKAEKRMGTIQSLWFLSALGLRQGWIHIGLVWRMCLRILRNYTRTVRQALS